VDTAIDGYPVRRRLLVLGVLVVSFVVFGIVPPFPAWAAAVLPSGFSDHLVAGGLNNPVGLAFFPDGRMLCIELKTGNVRLLIADTLVTPAPLFVVDSLRIDHNERGLLGIAVDARWPVRPYLYVDYTTNRSQNVWVSRYKVTGDLSFTGNGQLAVDPASRYDILTDMQDNDGPHNGGTLRFGPDGMLYVSIGEDAEQCQAQDLDRLGGKILRLDVGYLPDGPGGPPAKSLITPPFNPFPAGANGNAGLVWAYGLRNPYRFQVDLRTGVLYVVDVGAASFEEVDRVDESGLNFGWPTYEGPLYTQLCPSASTVGLRAPMRQWDRSEQPVAACVSAGVYRLRKNAPHAFLPEYEGDYFWADLASGWLRRLKRAPDGSWNTAPPVYGQPDSVTWGWGFVDAAEFLEGPDGSIYYTVLGPGQIRKVQCDIVVGVPDIDPRSGVALAAPWPSPARGLVHFAYQLPVSGGASLDVFDVDGRRVRSLIAGAWSPAERRVVSWDGRTDQGVQAPTGIYFASLRSGGQRWQQRFAWLR